MNVDGSRRVFEAAARAGVQALVHASSVGTYAPGPKDRAVDESWPHTRHPDPLLLAPQGRGASGCWTSFEREHPAMRVVRLRPGLIFKREAATGIRRLFAGPFLPGALLRKELIPVVPDVPRLRFQAVHSLDVGEAYRLAVVGDARGAFNVAAEPVLDPDVLGELLGARRCAVRGGVLRAAADAHAGSCACSPRPPAGSTSRWACPIMDIARARTELGWTPRHSAADALLELLEGLRDGADYPTPPLAVRRRRPRARARGPHRRRRSLGPQGLNTTLKAPSSFFWNIS